MTIDNKYHKKIHKKTILQLLPALNSGGVERGTIDVAKKIIDSGNNSIVVSSGGAMVKFLEDSGSLHITMGVNSKNPFKILINAIKITKIIRDYKVDVLHARSRAPAWSAYIASKFTDVYFVTTFHGVYNFNNSVKKWYNSVMTRGDHVIAVSNFVKKHILDNYEIDQNKLTTIHRGVNHHEFSKDMLLENILDSYKQKYKVPQNVPILLLPSRITKWKGHLILIDALQKIKHLQFYCMIVGDSSKHHSYIASINEKIEEYNLEDRVKIFNNEPNIMGLYGISDIILSTSVEPEAFGRTIIEAQAMEKIVIATNIGGASETIEDNVTGFQVAPNNSDELAKKIEYVISILGSKEGKIMVGKARNVVSEKFSLDQMLKKTMSVYGVRE